MPHIDRAKRRILSRWLPLLLLVSLILYTTGQIAGHNRVWIVEYGPDSRHLNHPLHPYAEKVFYMLKTGSQMMHKRLPVHSFTTIPRWPYHAVYGDAEDVLNGIEVIDVFQQLPKSLLASREFEQYRVTQQSVREHWQVDYSQLDGSRGWDTDKYKNIPMLAHAYQAASPDIEWFVFADDDTHFFQYGFLQYLKSLSLRQPVYTGSPAWIDIPAPDTDDGFKSITFGHGGSGVALNRKAMVAIFGKDPKDASHIAEVVEKFSIMARSYCCGDAMVSIALNEKGIGLRAPWGEYPRQRDGFQGGNLYDFGVADDGWCLPVFSWHHLSSREIENLREFEQRGAGIGRSVTYSDAYINFILPYLADEVADWDLGDSRWVIDEETLNDAKMTETLSHLGEDYSLEPHNNKEDCVRVCEEYADCMAWSYVSGKCRIFENYFVLGRAHNQYTIRPYTHAKSPVSGWMIDRIRESRSKSHCDPLEFDKTRNKWNDDLGDGLDIKEGWNIRWRQRQREQEIQSEQNEIESRLLAAHNERHNPKPS